jgi:hypothetical protein
MKFKQILTVLALATLFLQVAKRLIKMLIQRHPMVRPLVRYRACGLKAACTKLRVISLSPKGKALPLKKV